MAGIYDWILNSLKVDQSPATNHLPTPIPSQNITGLPVPFQTMPSESASYNPFMKLSNFFTNANVNPTIPQDAGTNPTAPNDPLKTASGGFNTAGMGAMLMKMMNGTNDGNTSKPPVMPTMPINVGNARQPNFSPMGSTPNSPNANSTRSAMLMKMLQQMPMDNGDFA